MINMPLCKCLLAALSVLSCVGAVAPSTTPEVAFDATAKMDPEMSGRALGAAPARLDAIWVLPGPILAQPRSIFPQLGATFLFN